MNFAAAAQDERCKELICAAGQRAHTDKTVPKPIQYGFKCRFDPAPSQGVVELLMSGDANAHSTFRCLGISDYTMAAFVTSCPVNSPAIR